MTSVKILEGDLELARISVVREGDRLEWGVKFLRNPKTWDNEPTPELNVLKQLDASGKALWVLRLGEGMRAEEA